jgi:hypothetical protein
MGARQAASILGGLAGFAQPGGEVMTSTKAEEMDGSANTSKGLVDT